MGVDVYLDWPGRPADDYELDDDDETSDALHHRAEWSARSHVWEFLNLLGNKCPAAMANCAAETLWQAAELDEEVPLAGLAEASACLAGLLEAYDPSIQALAKLLREDMEERQTRRLSRRERRLRRPLDASDFAGTASYLAEHLRRLVKSLRVLEAEGVDRVSLKLSP